MYFELSLTFEIFHQLLKLPFSCKLCLFSLIINTVCWLGHMQNRNYIVSLVSFIRNSVSISHKGIFSLSFCSLWATPIRPAIKPALPTFLNTWFSTHTNPLIGRDNSFGLHPKYTFPVSFLKNSAFALQLEFGLCLTFVFTTCYWLAPCCWLQRYHGIHTLKTMYYWKL